MANEYCMFKGKLKFGIPYLAGYQGNPHYGVIVDAGDGKLFLVLANVKSDSTLPGAGAAGYHVLYYWDQYFDHPMTPTLSGLAPGLHTEGFPRLDYYHDARLIGDLSRMRPIALDTAEEKNDINDLVNQMLCLDTTQAPQNYDFPLKAGEESRKAWAPTIDVTVYGFGFLFQPEQNGLHETHMNQGNPNFHGGRGDHFRENGAHQDGALIVEIGGKFQALLIAFQTQLVPTDNNGDPVRNAHAILAS